VAKPVNTVVATESTAPVRDGDAADQFRAPTTESAGLSGLPDRDLVAANGSAANGSAANGSAADVALDSSEDTLASEDSLVTEDALDAEDSSVTEDALDSEDTLVSGDAVVSEDALVSGDTGGLEREQADVPGHAADVPGDPEKSVNLEADGEPPDGDPRPTGVTATLSESAILTEIAPDDEALAPDTPATSALEAEESRQPAVWAAADVVTEIYHGHYHSLVRLAVLLVHDVQTAEEVVQDAFEAMHLASRRLRDSERALQYLRQTVVNKSRSVLRHRKVVDLHAPKPAPDEPSAEHAALAILERSAVAAALRALPERQREAIALRYYADFSEADIAKAMGISKGAVKSHTARAMASLKTMLTQEAS
jgi:RNA polymerase sigma-70 factor (sigma-E family)